MTGIGLHGKVLAYAMAENEQMSVAAVGRLVSVIKRGQHALDESDFWVLVEMVAQKMKYLVADDKMAAELVHTIANDVLTCAVSRFHMRGATVLGSKKVRGFIDDVSRIRFSSETPIFDHFYRVNLAEVEGDPLKLLPGELQERISDLSKNA